MSGFKVDMELDKALATITQSGEQGLRLGVEFLLTAANQTVPHEDGPLERSGEASVDGKRGAVSYDTPYAVRQHEDMSLRHDGKGEAKWLENTMGREAKTVGKIIAQAIRSKVGD